jgi:hypothetical protein
MKIVHTLCVPSYSLKKSLMPGLSMLGTRRDGERAILHARKPELSVIEASYLSVILTKRIASHVLLFHFPWQQPLSFATYQDGRTTNMLNVLLSLGSMTALTVYKNTIAGTQ